MSTGTVDRTGGVRTRRPEPPPPQHQPSGNWFAALGDRGRRAFRAAFAGYMLDAFDLIVLTLSLSAIGTTFAVGTGATGALSTVTLSASAIGGILGGVLADRIGRARTLMLTVAVYSLFTFLSGLATSYPMLMVFRVFQGIGFGGEWGVGAVLVAELVRPRSRGQALGVIQSSWAVGWAVAVLVYLLTFELFAETTAWRVLMCLGILPGLLILYIRRHVRDAEVYEETHEAEQQLELPLKQIFRHRLL
jgi:MFS family permease